MNNKGIELIKDLLVVLVINIEELGPCEHSNNICVCEWTKLKEKTENYLASLERENNEDCHKIELAISEAWEKLIGNEHTKRAIEVSLAGQHPITIIGDPDNGEEYLERVLGDLLTFRPTCPCGGYMDYKKSCTCSVSKLTKYRTSKTWQKALKNPIIIQLQPPTKFDYQIKQYETFQNIIDRINRKPDKSYYALESDAMDFLKVAIERLGLTLIQVENIKKVAKTIAELDNFERIMPYHLSEAIQYQNTNNF